MTCKVKLQNHSRHKCRGQGSVQQLNIIPMQKLRAAGRASDFPRPSANSLGIGNLEGVSLVVDFESSPEVFPEIRQAFPEVPRTSPEVTTHLPRGQPLSGLGGLETPSNDPSLMTHLTRLMATSAGGGLFGGGPIFAYHHTTILPRCGEGGGKLTRGGGPKTSPTRAGEEGLQQKIHTHTPLNMPCGQIRGGLGSGIHAFRLKGRPSLGLIARRNAQSSKYQTDNSNIRKWRFSFGVSTLGAVLPKTLPR